MIVAEYLLAWSVVAAAVTFGARLFRIPAEERHAQGLFAARGGGLRGRAR
jgi:hypothetical protein